MSDDHDDDCIDPDCFGDCDLWKHYCKFCGESITPDGQGVWVDRTDGDGCSGDDNLINENESHVPAPNKETS